MSNNFTPPAAMPARYHDKPTAAEVAANCADDGWVSLNDEDRDAAFNSLPNMLDGFMKLWGWLHFAQAVEQIVKEKNAPRLAAQDARIRQLEEALVATTVPLDLYHAYGWADRAGIREQVRAALKGDPS